MTLNITPAASSHPPLSPTPSAEQSDWHINVLAAVIAGVAGAALGFFVASYTGMAIGALVCTAIVFTATQVDFDKLWGPEPKYLPGTKYQIPEGGEDSIDIEDDMFATRSNRKYWLYGAQSIMLSHLLAVHRETVLSRLEAPALVPAKVLEENGLLPIKEYYPKVNPYGNSLRGTHNVPYARGFAGSANLRKSYHQEALNSLHFTKEEGYLITHSFPIIFAADPNGLEAIQEDLDYVGGYGFSPSTETFKVYKPLLLGKEIKHIFTPKIYVEFVENVLGSLFTDGLVEVLAIEDGNDVSAVYTDWESVPGQPHIKKQVPRKR